MEPLDPVFAARLNKTRDRYVSDCIDKQSVEAIRNNKIKELRRIVRMSHRPDSCMSRWKDTADYGLTMDILSAIQEASGYKIDDLRLSRKRHHGLSVARSIFVFIERTLNNRSYPDLGAILDKDHTSCIYMRWNVNSYAASSPVFAEFMKNCKLRELYDRAMSV